MKKISLFCILFCSMLALSSCSSLSTSYDKLQRETRTEMRVKLSNSIYSSDFMYLDLIKITDKFGENNYFYRTRYQSSSWLFAKNVYIYINGEHECSIHDKEPDRHLYTDSFYSYLIIEEILWARMDMDCLQKAMNAEKVDFRIEGDKKYSDFELTKKGKTKIKNFFKKYIEQ